VTALHGLTVEQVPDATLVEWMCQMRPGLPVAYADLALQALRTLHMTIHREGEPCGVEQVPAVCWARGSGLFGSALGCILQPHADVWHDNGRGTLWRDDTASERLMQAPVPGQRPA